MTEERRCVKCRGRAVRVLVKLVAQYVAAESTLPVLSEVDGR